MDRQLAPFIQQLTFPGLWSYSLVCTAFVKQCLIEETVKKIVLIHCLLKSIELLNSFTFLINLFLANL